MAVLRTRITGPVMLPDGSAAPDGAKVIFTLRSWDKQDGALIMRGPVEAVVEDGEIDVTLERTADGERGTLYVVAYSYFNTALRNWVDEPLGLISLDGDGPVNLADLLSLPAPIPTVPDVLAQALGAAASAAADRVQTGEDREATNDALTLAEAAAQLAIGTAPTTFETRAIAAQVNLDGFKQVTIKKFSATTDLAPAEYEMVAQPDNVEPSHPAKFQSADGYWFEISRGANTVIRDVQFGLVDDPTLSINQSATWTAFVTFGGNLSVTAGNTYYVPECVNINPSRETIITGTERGRYTKLVGSGSLVSGRITGGKDLYRPNKSFMASDIEYAYFSTIINGTNDVWVPTISFRFNYVHHCAYYHRGTLNVDSYHVNDNIFEDITDGLTLQTASTINVIQSFCRNRTNRTARFIWRINGAGDFYFDDNIIYDHTAGAFTGSAGVARVIMGGSHNNNWIRGNNIQKIIAEDGSPNLVYWSYGNLYVHNNTFGSTSGGNAGGYFIDEKSTYPKNVILSGNTFITTEGIGQMNGIVQRLTLNDGYGSTIIENNQFEELSASLLLAFNNTFSTGVGKPGKIIVRNNTIQRLNNQQLVAIVQGADDVDVSGNIVRNFSNARGAQFATGEYRKALVTVSSTSTTEEVSTTGLSIRQNTVHFTNEGESTARDGALIMMSGLTGNAIHAVVESNTVSGAQGYGMRRNISGDLRLVLKNNIALTALTKEFNSADGGTELAMFETEGNINLF